MRINIHIFRISSWLTKLAGIVSSEFGINEKIARTLLRSQLSSHIESLVPSCWVIVETNYVDKLYRDSYYHYFASKHGDYKKNCIRLSLFGNKISESDFRDRSRAKYLQDCFMGFIVLRPILTHIVGRNGISPKALVDNKFYSCLVKIPATVNGVKLHVEAFPHCSQDTESISCAETTLWALMEYFSIKYPEYESILPSNINSVLSDATHQRQLPSNGLNCEQISYALKKFGFEPQIYDSSVNNFYSILSCYIESGIPTIIAISNESSVSSKKNFEEVNHVFICIGREDTRLKNWASVKPLTIKSSVYGKRVKKRAFKFFDVDSINKLYVFVDDNLPAYKMDYLSKPTKRNYTDAYWHRCKITHFIVPLYRRIHVKAELAKEMVLQFLVNGLMPIRDVSDIVLRTFLCSSRSYKQYIANSSDFPTSMKELFLETATPKFIWVTEISSKPLLEVDKCSGLVVIDATEADLDEGFGAILFTFYDNFYFNYLPNLLKFQKFKVTLHPFAKFMGNLI